MGCVLSGDGSGEGNLLFLNFWSSVLFLEGDRGEMQRIVLPHSQAFMLQLPLLVPLESVRKIFRFVNTKTAYLSIFFILLMGEKFNKSIKTKENCCPQIVDTGTYVNGSPEVSDPGVYVPDCSGSFLTLKRCHPHWGQCPHHFLKWQILSPSLFKIIIC